MLDKRYGNDGEFILEMAAEMEQDESDEDTEAEHLDLALHPDDNIDDEDRTSTRKRRRSGSKVASSRCNYKSQYDDKWYESSRDRRRPEDQGRHAGEQSNKRRKAESHSSRSKDDASTSRHHKSRRTSKEKTEEGRGGSSRDESRRKRGDDSGKTSKSKVGGGQAEATVESRGAVSSTASKPTTSLKATPSITSSNTPSTSRPTASKSPPLDLDKIEPISVLQCRNRLDHNCNRIIRSRKECICMTMPKYARLYLYLYNDAEMGKTASVWCQNR